LSFPSAHRGPSTSWASRSSDNSFGFQSVRPRRARTRTALTGQLLARGRVELFGQSGKPWRGTAPLQAVHRLEEVEVRAKSRQIAEQEGAVALAEQRPCKRRGTRCVHAPGLPVFGNRFEMAESRKHGGRRLRAPAQEPRISVRSIADERQIIGNGF